MPQAQRIDVDPARRKVESGEALLVCAYDDEEKYRDNELDRSISLDQLRSRSVDRNQEIVFYCA